MAGWDWTPLTPSEPPNAKGRSACITVRAICHVGAKSALRPFPNCNRYPWVTVWASKCARVSFGQRNPHIVRE